MSRQARESPVLRRVTNENAKSGRVIHPPGHTAGYIPDNGYITMGGIEYDDGDCVEKTKKAKVSH